MIAQLPALVVVAPLLAGLLTTLFGWFNKKWALPTSIVGLAISFFSAVGVLMAVLSDGPVTYRMAGWAPPYGIEYVVDHLNALMIVMVSAVSLLVIIFSTRSVAEEISDKIPHYYSLFTLLVTGLLGISISGDTFNVFVLLEISALTSYALIALGKGRAYLATFNYLIVGSIGASFYLLGVGYLLLKTGTLNMIDISRVIAVIGPASESIFVAFVLIMIGFMVKMALFPMHGWLPNAYTYAPTATSCLVAPLMTKVSVYVMIRMMLTVFSGSFAFSQPQVMLVFQWLAVAAIVFGSIYALAQTHLKTMLTYLIIAEIGYMVGGAWLGNIAGLTGAIFHIIADGFMTLCLFLCVGAVIHVVGHGRLEAMKGIFQKMPVTMTAFLIAAASMIGVPPTCGFFSKFYLLSGAFQAGAWAFFVALIFSSLVNAVLFFRIIEIGFFSALPNEDAQSHSHASFSEAPLSMLVPIVITGATLLILGIYSQDIITHFIRPMMPSILF